MSLLTLFQLNLGTSLRTIRYFLFRHNVRPADPIERMLDAEPMARIVEAENLQRELPA